MRKISVKFIVLFLIAGLNWFGLSAIGRTWASFNDIETSLGNTYVVGSLDFSVRSGQGNFVPPEIASDMKPGGSVARDIYIKKDGSLPFRYKAYSEAIEGFCDPEFYELLELKVWYNYYTALPTPPNYHEHRIMALKYSGPLKDFQMDSGDADLQIPNSHPYFDNVFYGPDEHWFYFSITYPEEAEKLYGQSCQFKFVFEGWQTNLTDSSSGFSDKEEISNFLADSIFVEEEPLVIEIENEEPVVPVVSEEEPIEEEPIEEEPMVEEPMVEEPMVEEPMVEEPVIEEEIIEEDNIFEKAVEEVEKAVEVIEEAFDEIFEEEPAEELVEGETIEEEPAKEELIEESVEEPAGEPVETELTEEPVDESAEEPVEPELTEEPIGEEIVKTGEVLAEEPAEEPVIEEKKNNY